MISSSIATEVADCKALIADSCSGIDKCRIAQAKEICFQEKTFQIVKWIPPTNTAWFSGDDDLKGTHVVGTRGDATSEWSIDFSGMTFTNLLFASGDFVNWLITDDAFLNKNSGTPTPYP